MVSRRSLWNVINKFKPGREELNADKTVDLYLRACAVYADKRSKKLKKERDGSANLPARVSFLFLFGFFFFFFFYNWSPLTLLVVR